MIEDLPGAARATRACAALLLISVAVSAQPQPEAPARSWPRWGGPEGDFRAPAASLAESWPSGGPKVLWRRPLGDGYSAIAFEEGRLYTMYREGGREAVVSLSATTGETLWEQSDEIDYVGMAGYGTGPRATPLVAGDRLFTAGVSGRLQAFDRHSGRRLWSRELWGSELAGNRLSHGYASSPLGWRDLVIVAVGGEGASLVAFDQASGETRWQAHDFRNSYSSPILLELVGEDQVVAFMAGEVVGVDPATGRLRWSYPHANQWGANVSLPTALDGDTLFLSSPQAGARGLRLFREGDEIRVEELWASRRAQFYHVATARQGDWIFGSSGTTSPAFLTAINGRTGEIAWRERGIPKANTVAADGRLIVLDEDGRLYLVNATPEELVVVSEYQLLERLAWTPPTIVGHTLFARDRQVILAMDLG